MRFVFSSRVPTRKQLPELRLVRPDGVDCRATATKHGLCTSLVSNMYFYTFHSWRFVRYDLKALFEKAFGDFSVNVQDLSRGMFFLKTFYWGQRGSRKNYSSQIRNLVERGYHALGEKPVIIGECGIPMDMKYVSKSLSMDNGFNVLPSQPERSIPLGRLHVANSHDGLYDDRAGAGADWFHVRLF